jgi:hypothetical protein
MEICDNISDTTNDSIVTIKSVSNLCNISSHPSISISIIDSITSGTISKSLQSELNFKKLLLGSVIIYDIETQKKFLNMNDIYINNTSSNNRIDVFNSFIMAKDVANLFKSRIGLSISSNNLLDDNDSIFYVCIYDSKKSYNKIHILDYMNFLQTQDISKRSKRSKSYLIKNKLSFDCKKIFYDYCIQIENDNHK